MFCAATKVSKKKSVQKNLQCFFPLDQRYRSMLLIDSIDSLKQDCLSLDSIEQLVEGRVKLYSQQTLPNIQKFMSEEEDCASHLLLRLCISYIADKEITSFFLQKETEIFLHKVRCADASNCFIT